MDDGRWAIGAISPNASMQARISARSVEGTPAAPLERQPRRIPRRRRSAPTDPTVQNYEGTFRGPIGASSPAAPARANLCCSSRVVHAVPAARWEKSSGNLSPGLFTGRAQALPRAFSRVLPKCDGCSGRPHHCRTSSGRGLDHSSAAAGARPRAAFRTCHHASRKQMC